MAGRVTVALVLFNLLIVQIHAFGADYFVSPRGADASAGASATTAWATLAHAEQADIKPGDSILLERGGVWREGLNIKASGTPNQPITIGAFGEGPAPLLIGAIEVNRWEKKWGILASADFPRLPLSVYTEMRLPMSCCATMEQVGEVPYSWCYSVSEKQLYVNAAYGRDANKVRILATVLGDGIESHGQSNLVIRDLALRWWGRSGIFCEGGNNITVQSCDIRNVGNSAVMISPAANATAPLEQVHLLDNSIGRIDSSPVLDYDRAGLLVCGTSGAVITGNHISTANKLGVRVRSWNKVISAKPTVSKNDLFDNQGNISIADTDGAVVMFNHVHDSKGFGIGIGHSSDATVAFNVIENLAISDDLTLYNGIDCNDLSLRGKCVNNTIRSVTNWSITLEDDNKRACNDWVVMNNIFDCRGNVPYPTPGKIDETGAIDMHPYTLRVTAGHNVYTPSGLFPGKICRYHQKMMDAVDWSKATGDVASKVGDPRFVDPTAGDIRLMDDSPARGLAQPVDGVNVTENGSVRDAGAKQRDK